MTNIILHISLSIFGEKLNVSSEITIFVILKVINSIRWANKITLMSEDINSNYEFCADIWDEVVTCFCISENLITWNKQKKKD